MLSEGERQEALALREENARLRGENADLRAKLDEEKMQRTQWESEGNHQALEARACRKAISEVDKDADILVLYNELHRLRQQCAVYAEAVEESRGYFFELKRLYLELEKHQSRQASQQAP